MPHPIRRPRRVVAMLLLGAFAAAVPSVHAGETRTWTDKTGKFRIEAEFVGEESLSSGTSISSPSSLRSVTTPSSSPTSAP